MEPDATGIWRAEQSRHCPRCTYPLTSIAYQGAEIDHCHRCGGTVVEPGNIKAHFGEYAEPEHWLETLGHATTGEALKCPVDGGRMTGFQVPFGGRSVVIDHCDTCGSLWFDKGEGQKLAYIVRDAMKSGDVPTPGEASVSAARIPSADRLAAEQDRIGKPGLNTYLFQLFTGMPVEVWNPVHGRTLAMKTIFWTLIAVFALQIYFILGASEEAANTFMQTFGAVPELVLKGQHLWSILTHMFLHAGIMHLFGNAYFLWVFGDNVEDRIGTNRFVALYFAAGLAAVLLQLPLQPEVSTPMVGASGAISGLMGAYLMLFPRVKLWVVFFFMHWRVPIWIYLGIWFAFQGGAAYLGLSGVAWWAHIGGFVAGLVLGWVFRGVPHPLAPQEQRVVESAPR